MRLTSPLNLPAPGRRQCVYGALRGLAHTCVFAKQSLGPIRCDQRRLRCTLHPLWHPFFRSYGISMPSSLTTSHSFTLGYSPHPPVSVSGTVAAQLPIELFLPVDSTRLGTELPPALVLPSRLTPTRLNGHHMTARTLFRCPSMVHHCAAGPDFQLAHPSATPLGPRLRGRLTLR